MGGYIGSSVGNVANAAERKQTYSITTATTSLTGLAYTPTKVHVFHNGVRLVDSTDYTATNGTSITLTNAAQNGDEVVVISYPSFQTSDTVSAANGGTFAGNVIFSGTTTGLDVNGTDLILDADGDSKIVASTDDTISIHTSGSEKFKIDGDGHVTMPTQSAFSAKVGSQINNMTAGGASNITIPFDTEIFDQNSDYNTNGTFTAPVAGKYLLMFHLRLETLDTTPNTYDFNLATSNRSYTHRFDPDLADYDANFYHVNLTVLADMDANDTSLINYYQDGGGAQTDIDPSSFFMGYLVC